MKRVATYLRVGLPIPMGAILVLFLLSLGYMEISDPTSQLAGYWPGVDVSIATRTLLVGVGCAAVSAWVSQRWAVQLRMTVSARSGWGIAVRDLIRLYVVVFVLFVFDYAIVAAYRLSGAGGGFPRISIIVSCSVWLLFSVTVGWAIGTRIAKAAAVFATVAVMTVVSVASVMANDGHIGFPLLAGRQLPSLPSYGVELSPVKSVTAVGIGTTVLCAALVVFAATRQRSSWTLPTMAVAVGVLVPVTVSLVTGGSAWLQPRAAASEPRCVGEQPQVCSWSEDSQRLGALEPSLPRLTEAMRATGYPIPGRVSVATAVPDAEAEMCPFRTPTEAITGILGRVPVGSRSCIGSDRLEHCSGDIGQRSDYSALTQVYLGWLVNYSLSSGGSFSIHSDGTTTDESRAVERVLTWPRDAQLAFMSRVHTAITGCAANAVHVLLEQAERP
ncbi:hypothetical protein AB0L57_03225 [Nocardia sp. NPDC052254]|uniref:DUF7224 domain-containing protein n=1 Tax=Nocardia sp. NPDC052254 TaxID=3155681 RepID=UPI003434BF3C